MNLKRGISLLNRIVELEIKKQEYKYVCSCGRHYSNFTKSSKDKAICGGVWKYKISQKRNKDG